MSSYSFILDIMECSVLIKTLRRSSYSSVLHVHHPFFIYFYSLHVFVHFIEQLHIQIEKTELQIEHLDLSRRKVFYNVVSHVVVLC